MSVVLEERITPCAIFSSRIPCRMPLRRVNNTYFKLTRLSINMKMVRVFILYGNLLSDEASQSEEKIIEAQMTNTP